MTAMTTLDGVRLHYHQRGAPGRPQLVLLHGLATNTAFWFPLLLPELARDYLVTAYDLRGHGRSEMPPSGYGTRDMAGDLHALLRHVGVDRVHLVGHSFGGAVALHYAALHPGQVASLTVADTRLAAFQQDARWIEWLGGDAGPVRARLAAPTAERWRLLLRDTNARREMLAVPGPSATELARVGVPVLAIFGERSEFLPSCRGLQRVLPRCRVAVVPAAGHFHPRRRPEVFIRHLRGFLSEVAA